MAKNTGSYDDPIPVVGLFSKTINGEKKFFILKSGQASQGPSVTYTKLSQLENDTGFIAEDHNFANGITINGVKLTIG